MQRLCTELLIAVIYSNTPSSKSPRLLETRDIIVQRHTRQAAGSTEADQHHISPSPVGQPWSNVSECSNQYRVPLLLELVFARYNGNDLDVPALKGITKPVKAIKTLMQHVC